jgi:mannose-6-phosphate isomerase-like protein (cupin superfamily)
LASAGLSSQFSRMQKRTNALRATKAINPLNESGLVAETYHNCRLAAVNDHEIRMSVMTSGFEWHNHPRSDEAFLVIEGELLIEFEDRKVLLGEGDLFTVPKGVTHRTRPVGPRSVNLTFECRDTPTVFVCDRSQD